MQSQRAAPRKQSQKPSHSQGISLIGKNTKLTFREIPYSTETTQSQPTWLRMEGKVTHPELGGGVRIAGRQYFTNITTTAGDNQIFSANGATIAGMNQINISPDLFNGRLALQARTYDRYCFRKLRFTYVPRVPTSQVGSFVMGYVGDAIAGPTLTFLSVSSMSPSIQTTFYGSPIHFDAIDDMETTKYFYTLYDSASTASIRQTAQGMLLGYPDAPSIGATTMGGLWVDYLIDLYQPTVDMGFSIRMTPEEQELIVNRRKNSTISSSDISTEIGSLQLRIQQLKSGSLGL
jgi:hypothetical protein